MPVPTAISTMVTDSAFLRPTRSPYSPSNTPPSGRTAKPMPKVASVSISDASALSAGKNSRAIVTANSP
jgi:hypothetical protein